MNGAAEALGRVRRRIADACARCDRDPSTVRLVAVSKTVSPERVREMIASGHACFGENRVQEALAKISAVGEGARWHFVGHLQKNKCRHAVGVFELIHSVDSDALAVELDRRAGAAGVVQPVLVQVNLSHEATKHGTDESSVVSLLATIAGLGNLDVRGLMTVPPPAEEAEGSRRWFRTLRELRDRCRERTDLPLSELSMGMTDDFEVAIEEGATIVRVGRALFGARP